MRTFSDRALARSNKLPKSPPPPPIASPPVPEPLRTQRILKWIWEQITFKRVVFAAIGIPLAAYLFWDANRHFVVLDPIVVPKQFADAGLTSEVMTQRVREKLEEIQRTDESASSRAQLSMQADRDVPDIEIPETKLSLRVLSDALRKVLHNDPEHLSGEITLDSSGKIEIRSRVLRSSELIQAGKPRPLDTADPDHTTVILAQELTELTDPYLVGMYLYNNKDFASASDVAKRMLERPDDGRNHMYAKALLLQGYIANDQGQPEEAVRNDKAAIRFEPKWAYAHHCLGFVLQDQHKIDDAAAEYQTAIQLDPKSATPHNNLGNLLHGQNKPDKAAAEYQAAIQLDPKSAEPHNGLGNIFWSQHNLADAAAEYQRAIQLDPKYSYPHNGLGNVLQDQHNLADAAAEYQRAIQFDPRSAYPHNGMGNVLHAQHNLDEAAAEYQKAIQLDPTEALYHNNLQLLFREQGKQNQADVELKAAHDLAPTTY